MLLPDRLAAAAGAAVRELMSAAVALPRGSGRRAGAARRHQQHQCRRHRRRVLVAWAVEPLEPRQLLSAALDLIGVTALRADPDYAGIDGSGLTVAVIDTGVDFTHPLLSAAEVDEYDFHTNSSAVTLTDEHGTHVAGIVGARNPSIGVAPAVGLVGLQVFTPTSGGSVLAYDSDTESALQWVYDHRAQYHIVAVNMSLGSGNYASAAGAGGSILLDDVRRLESAGVTVVAAAGNNYGSLQTPGSAAPAVFSTLSVGAVYETNEGRVSGGGQTDFTTAADRIAFFSQRPNTSNELFAPGAFITSTVPGGGLKDLAGTSMASPMVAGVVALMQDAAQTYAGRLLSTTEVRTILQQTAEVVVDGDDENTSVQTTGQSYLRVNAYGAVQYIKNDLGGTGGNASPDPNGTIATAVTGPTLAGGTATPVTGEVGTDGQTVVGPADVDLVKFVVNAPGAVNVTLGGTGFQPALRVFNAGGTQLGANAPSAGGGTVAAVSLSLAAGTYYAGVSGSPNTGYNPTIALSGSAAAGTGAYSLSFDQADNTDVDGVLSAATPINLTSGNVPQALDAGIGDDAGGTVGGKDVDFYKVVAPDTGELLIDIDTLSDPYADTYLRVFNASGTEIGHSDDDLAIDITGDAVEFDPDPATSHVGDAVLDGGGNAAGHDTDSFIDASVTKGQTYYVAVCNYENRAFSPTSVSGRVAAGSTGAYSLFVSLRNRDVNGAIPQAVTQAALPIEAAPGTIGVDGRADGSGTVAVGDRDVDFIRLHPTESGILEFDVDSLQDAPDLTDTVRTVLRLFDEEGTLLATEDGGSGVGTDGGPTDPLLRYEVSADADYYVAVAGFGNNAFDPFILGSGGSGDTGNYRYNARVLSLTDATSLSDDSSTGGQVKALAVGAQTAGNLGDDDGFVRGATDVDIYTFAPPADGFYSFAAGPSDDFGADTFLRLFAADGTQIAADDNGAGMTGGSMIQANLSAGQTYLVGVSGAGPDAAAYDPITGANAGAGSTGGYVLDVSAIEAPLPTPTPTPTPTPSPTGPSATAVRTLPLDAGTKAVYIDADGTTVTVTLKGPGTGTLEFATDGDADASRLVLTGTTEQTTLTVKGETMLGGLVADGALKSVAGKSLDLTGTVSAAGGVAKSVVVRGISDAAITVGGAGLFSLTAGDVFDTTLFAPGGIKAVKVRSWTDSDGSAPDTITAPQVLSVTSAGDFGGDVSATVLVGTVKVAGTLRGDVRSAGSITTVSAGAIASAAVFAGVDLSFADRLPTAFADPAAQIKSFVVKGKFLGSFDDARLAAPTLRKATLGDVLTVNDGVPFGVVSDLIGSLAGSFDGGSEKIKSKHLSDPSQSVVRADAVIRLV